MGLTSATPFTLHTVLPATGTVLMPDFAQNKAGFAHTVNSAANVLDSLGVPESRLTLRMAGPGRQALQIVRQSPSAGTPLSSSTQVTLWISGFGTFAALPFPMRESGGEAEMGTREICQMFDDPIQKAAQWFRVGAPLFAIGPTKLASCRRWLGLFGIDYAGWPDHLLYSLALLAPTLAHLAGRRVGVQLAFLVLFGLPIAEMSYELGYRHLPTPLRSKLGTHASRLGSDLVMGHRQLDVDALIIRVGPVSLDTYTHFQSDEGRALLQRTSGLCLSAYQSYRFVWAVGDPAAQPRLGIAQSNSRIGINFHLGRGGVI